MAALLRGFKWLLTFMRNRGSENGQTKVAKRSSQVISPPLDIAPDDPIMSYFLRFPETIDIDKLQLDGSPALQTLKAAGVKLAVPLVNQGELVGLLNLGPRRSEQDYSTDDRGLLNALASQAAPAVRVAQMIHEQQIVAREHERLEQELRVAQLIQQTLLPKQVPELPGWKLSTYYSPARFVGGDFYDFIRLEDGRLGILIGDVTDKGVPAALLMATTRSFLRAIAMGGASPGKVLEQTNSMLHPDIPPKMFVTCLYAILDPRTGLLRFANAGHDLPRRWSNGPVAELQATGMPLGLMPDMTYDEQETTLAPGEHILLYSDGLVEAHNPAHEMFGFPRLTRILSEMKPGSDSIHFLLEQLWSFVGTEWEPEDDVTLVTLQRLEEDLEEDQAMEDEQRRMLVEWTIPSVLGNERLVMTQINEAVAPFQLSRKRLERLQTAVAEATLNAMEHGNHYQPDLPVHIQVLASATDLVVRVKDRGQNLPIPEPEKPDIEAKLAELQTPRGWGLFLMKNLVDDMHISNDDTYNTIELVISLRGDAHVDENL
jgi:serine phosphatase RsbU (regulator of sigma subunit)/anti-sigma regulatory factor (Ser/Thr protein kinase)